MGDRFHNKGGAAPPQRDSRGYAREDPPERKPRRPNTNNQRDNRNSRDEGRRRAHSVGDRKDYYGSGRDDRRHSNDDYYYGRRDSGDRRRDSRGKDDYYGSKDDYYGGGGRGYEKDRRSNDGDSHDEDWICVKCSCKNRPYERRCYDCGRHKSGSPVSSEDEFGRPNKKEKKTSTSRQWPPVFEGNSDKFVLDSRSGMFYDSTSDFFYDPASKLYYGNKKKSYFSYNASTKKFLSVDAAEGEEQPAAPRGSTGDADVAEADQMMIMPHGADAVKKDIAVAAPKIAINIKTAAPKPDTKKRKKRSESNADKKAPGTTAAPPTKVQKKHAENMEKWQERQREMNPESLPRVTNQGKPICWLCKRKFATEEKLKLHEEKSQLHKDNLEKEQQKKKQEPKNVVECGTYVDRAKQRRDLYGPDLVVPANAPPQVSPISDPMEVSMDRPMENPTTTNIGHQMMEKMGWKAGGTLGRGSEEQQQQQAALAKDWDRIEGIAAQNSSAPVRRPR